MHVSVTLETTFCNLQDTKCVSNLIVASCLGVVTQPLRRIFALHVDATGHCNSTLDNPIVITVHYGVTLGYFCRIFIQPYWYIFSIVASLVNSP